MIIMAKKTTSSKPVFKMGWLPDQPGARDFVYSAPLKVSMNLPPKVDLRATCPPVCNQGQLGSCAANALSGAFAFGKKKQRQAVFMPSRLFLYYNERAAIQPKVLTAAPFLEMALNP
jgi:hypothetical protein